MYLTANAISQTKVVLALAAFPATQATSLCELPFARHICNVLGDGEPSRLALIFRTSFFIWVALAFFYGMAQLKLSFYDDLEDPKKKVSTKKST